MSEINIEPLLQHIKFGFEVAKYQKLIEGLSLGKYKLSIEIEFIPQNNFEDLLVIATSPIKVEKQ